MTTNRNWVILGAILLTVAGGFVLGTGLMTMHIYVMLLLFIAFAYLLGRWVKTEREPWLPGLLVIGMIAKLVGSSLRYYVLEVIYHGSGDAGRYHSFGILIAETWRNFTVPDMTTVAFGSEGTRFTAWITGLLYSPYEPSQLGGFWILSVLAFIGQFFFYLAFRTATPDDRWKRYAILIFFWPTLAYWPSSIGKEALLILFLGVASWAVAHLYRMYQLRWLPLIAGAVFLVSIIRVHLAVVFAGAIVGALLFEHRRGSARPAFNKVVILLAVAGAAIPVTVGAADRFGIDLATVGTDTLDPVFSDVGDMTEQGGSAVRGGVIRTPFDVPAGVLKVLFRPLPIEATNLQMFLASFEGMALLALVGWQTPSMLRNRNLLRKSPYILYCAIFSALFVWAWSAILNLGILARQRSLVFPLLFALIAGLGWYDQTASRRGRVAGQTFELEPTSGLTSRIGMPADSIGLLADEASQASSRQRSSHRGQAGLDPGIGP